MNWRYFIATVICLTVIVTIIPTKFPDGSVSAQASFPAHMPISPLVQTTPDACGGTIAFTSFRDSNSEIYVMNADGTGQTQLTNHTATDAYPSWSPDGSKIAFQSDRDNPATGRGDIYTMNADGSNVTRLTTNAAFDEAPVWSPDGSRIAFLSTRDDPNNNIRQLYIMKSDGSAQTRITFGDSIQPRFTWSPDSSKLAFSAPVGGGLPPDILRIHIISASGGTGSALTNPTVPESDIQPNWSPDGQRVSFVRLRSGQNGTTEVYLVNADGSGLKNLTNNSVDDSHPAWSPDASSIAFVSNRDGNREIYLMYPDGSGQMNLTKHPAHDQDPAWQPTMLTAPCLLGELGTDRATALASVTFVREPFTLTTPYNLSTDQRTRMMLFCRNLRLAPGEDMSVVTAQAEDAAHLVTPLPVELVRTVPGFSWLTQINVRLPANLNGDVQLSLSLRGVQSNQRLVSIAPVTP